jgi:cytochrome c
MKQLASFILISLALLTADAALAVDRGSPEEAKALALNAAALFESKGPAAIEAFNATKDSFVDRDLYITVIDHQGVVRASSGPSAALIGKNTWDAEDSDGKKFVQEFWNITDGGANEGWLTYRYVDQVTKKLVQKRTFVRRIGDYVLTCGSYIAE